MFSVLLAIISSLIAYLELSIASVHMNIVRQRIRNTLRQSLVSKDTRKAKRRDALNLTSRDASGLDLAERVRGETTLLTKLLPLKNGEKFSNVYLL